MIDEISPETHPLYDELDKLDTDELVMLKEFIEGMIEERKLND